MITKVIDRSIFDGFKINYLNNLGKCGFVWTFYFIFVCCLVKKKDLAGLTKRQTKASNNKLTPLTYPGRGGIFAGV